MNNAYEPKTSLIERIKNYKDDFKIKHPKISEFSKEFIDGNNTILSIMYTLPTYLRKYSQKLDEKNNVESTSSIGETGNILGMTSGIWASLISSNVIIDNPEYGYVLLGTHAASGIYELSRFVHKKITQKNSMKNSVDISDTL